MDDAKKDKADDKKPVQERPTLVWKEGHAKAMKETLDLILKEKARKAAEGSSSSGDNPVS